MNKHQIVFIGLTYEASKLINTPLKLAENRFCEFLIVPTYFDIKKYSMMM